MTRPPQKSTLARIRRRKRRQRGRCAECAAASATYLCTPCAEGGLSRDSQYQSQRQADMIAVGLCPSCGEPRDREAGQKGAARLCTRCVNKMNTASNERYEALRAARRCVKCGAASREQQLCDDCRAKRQDYQRQRYREAREAGLCVRCREPSGGKTYCQGCAAVDAERVAERAQQRIRDGICVRCGKRPPREGAQQCPGCLARSRRWQAKGR